jgi:hypothetical protein
MQESFDTNELLEQGEELLDSSRQLLADLDEKLRREGVIDLRTPPPPPERS